MNIFNSDDTIVFEEKTHQYFTKITREELKSTSKIIEIAKKSFDSKTVSMRMAKGDPNAQKEILGQWDKKRNDASDHGNFIHNNLEKYAYSGKIHPDLYDVAMKLQPIFNYGYKIFPEARIYSLRHMIAGTSDLVVQRQRSYNSVFDFYDYKTNLSRGIQFDSIRRKDGKMSHYNNFMLPPLSHLEDCNYNHYVLQLSIYALMAELTWGLRIGRLAILFISPDYKLTIIPVAYMRTDALALLEYKLKLKPLPNIKKEVEIDDDDDW